MKYGEEEPLLTLFVSCLAHRDNMQRTHKNLL